MAYRLVCVFGVVIALSISGRTQEASSSNNAPVSVPVTITETVDQTYKAMISVGIGSVQPLSITLDTGSVGLVVFDVPGIPGNGVTCNDPFSKSFGNPLRVTYSGIICSGPINLAGVISTRPIRFGLLTATTFCAKGFQCKTPQENYAAGIYGVFGAGITPGLELPNPLRTLPGAYGRRFMLRLNANTDVPSSLILAPVWRFNAAIFPQGEQTVGARKLPTYGKGLGCVLVNTQAASVCSLVSFDTGNGVPWFHANIPNLPTVASNGTTLVAPGTTIGVAPRLGGPSVITLVAGDSFAEEFRYEDLKSDLINVSIQAFFANDVIFDGEQGVITVAPTNASPE
jgi:hypothetical protein